MGITWVYLGVFVLVPLTALVLKARGIGWTAFSDAATDPRAIASYGVSFGGAMIAALVNLVFGVILAWVLARYRFPGRSVIDALVDLPFALPTAVAGLTLTAVYAKDGLIGQILEPLGVHVVFTRLGIVVAMTFVGLPFVVRTVQPVIEELDPALEEAAATLGASRFDTFRSVIFPAVLPSALTGFALALARAVGEYGSVIFISGNMPLRTEITPLLIVTKLEQYDYGGAAALAVVMLVASFVLLLAINVLQRWSVAQRGGRTA